MPIRLVALLFSFALTGAGTAQAQSYPSRPIKVVVPFAAGGPQDGIIRMLSQKAAVGLGQSFVIENKAGAGGLIAAEPVANLADFIALAKSKPGALTFASTGTGTISHLIGDAFKYAADIDILHVPYKGAAQGLPDLLAGQVNAMFTSAAAAHGYLSAKRLRALALASDVRLPSLPDVPTFAQAGIKD